MEKGNGQVCDKRFYSFYIGIIQANELNNTYVMNGQITYPDVPPY